MTLPRWCSSESRRKYSLGTFMSLSEKKGGYTSYCVCVTDGFYAWQNFSRLLISVISSSVCFYLLNATRKIYRSSDSTSASYASVKEGTVCVKSGETQTTTASRRCCGQTGVHYAAGNWSDEDDTVQYAMHSGSQIRRKNWIKFPMLWFGLARPRSKIQWVITITWPIRNCNLINIQFSVHFYE
jgi:hypothetical protein